MMEYEKTYLAKQIPMGLKECKSIEIIDIYIPKVIEAHAPIRIRKNGDKYEITKKSTAVEGNHSIKNEQTIILSRNEFELLSKEISGRRLRKIRYYYPCNGKTAEVDVFTDALTGLITIDIEFENEEEMKNFKMPFICLADVSQEDFIAGGMLCGKKYSDLEKDLARFNYQKLYLK